jgi:hypothetical protein
MDMSRLFEWQENKNIREKKNRLVHEKFGTIFTLGMQSGVSCHVSIMWSLWRWNELNFFEV